jgi:hypothetical protein
MTMRGLDRRAVDNEHEQESGNDPRHRRVPAKRIMLRLSGLHSEPCATFRVAMLDVRKRTCQREFGNFPNFLVQFTPAVLSRLGCNLSPVGFLS